jgi:alanyl aminopeptidase
MNLAHRVLLFSLTLLQTISTGVALADTPPVPKLRLGDEARPLSYSAELVVVPEASNFTGRITVNLSLNRTTSFLWLNGHGLVVSNAYLEQGGKRISAQPVIGGEEFIGFDFQQNFKPGKASLVINYSGAMSDKDFSGLFRREEQGRWYAVTQFESTWARRTFPCFDEPGFKVPWKLAVHVKQGETAISNGNVISEINEADGMKCVRFAPTRPIPSYLVAVAVGPFDMVDLGKVGRKNTPVRIFTPKGRTADAGFAAQAIPQLLCRLEDYYDLPFPYEKLDHVTVPQFFGGMENAGIIIYEETFILSPTNRQTIGFKRNCANGCAHEMAHQWFGDLVTMSWWDDIWLNESFATWISPKVVDDWQPEWKSGLDQLRATFGAMREDSLDTARRIRQPIETLPDIDNAFDSITYDKGAGVLKMFETAMGPEPFRKAIKAYLRRHAYKNATATDFLHSLDQVAHQDIGTAFSTFLDQSGIPLIRVNLGGAFNGAPVLELSQKRYLPIGSAGDSNRRWNIPLRLRYQSGGREDKAAMRLEQKQQSLPLAGASGVPAWILLNEHAAGYFVGAYPGPMLSNLLAAGSAKLAAAERMCIAHSISAAVRAAEMPLGEALSLQPALLLDPERRVVEMTAGFMHQRENVPPELLPNYQRFVRKAVDPLIKDLHWKSARPENDDERLRRLVLLSLAAEGGEEDRLIAEAKELALGWLKDRSSLPPDEAERVVAVAGRFADRSLFEAFRAEIKEAHDPADKQRLISALGSCKDSTLAQEVLDRLAAGDFQSVDSLILLFTLSSHIETRSLTFDYLKQHYDAVVAALPGDSLFAGLPKVAEGFDSAERQAEMESFFKDKDPKLTGGPRTIAQTAESIHLNQAFKQAQVPSLVAFLKNQ